MSTTTVITNVHTTTPVRPVHNRAIVPRTSTITPRTWHSRGAGFVSPPQLELGDNTAARILHLAHTEQHVQRDRAATLTHVSRATVNRSVLALLEAGFLTERDDLTDFGAIGRPAVPIALNDTSFAIVALYLGRWNSSVTLHNLNGKILAGKNVSQGIATASSPGSLLAEIKNAALHVLGLREQRRVLWAGIAAEAATTSCGRINDAAAGWEKVNVGEYFATELGLPVSLAAHVEAMSAAELWNTPAEDVTDFTLYVYARETLGISIAYSGKVHHSATGSGTFGHFAASPTQLLDPQHTGTVAGAVTDSAVIAAAQHAGIVVHDVDSLVELATKGNTTAKTILRERATVLGEAVNGLVRLLNPSRVVLGGQAFTDYSEGLSLIASFARKDVDQVDIRISAARSRVQQQAAAAVAITAVAVDPLAALEHARRQ